MATQMQQKVLKMKRMRRAYLQKKPARVDPYRTAELFAMMRKGLERMGDEVPRTLGISDPKMAIQVKIELLRKLESMPDYKHIKLINRKYMCVLMFFDHTHKKYFFVRKNDFTAMVETSIVYPSRERAMDNFNYGHITWVERVLLPIEVDTGQ